MTGQKQSMLFATNAYKAELRLVYANRQTSEIALLMAHYDKQDGTHSSFQFPGKWAEQVWAGWDKVRQDEKILAINGRWRYASPPRITQQRGKVATAEIVLLQVPGTKNVRISGAPPKTCPGAGPPITPGTPIDPAPGAPEGPPGNGPPGFPGGNGASSGGSSGGGGGGGGNGDGDGGDGSGSGGDKPVGPGGGGTTPSPGPGDPLPPPPEPPDPNNPDDWDGLEVQIPEDVRDNCYKFKIEYTNHGYNAATFLCGSDYPRFAASGGTNPGIIYSSPGYLYKLEYVRTRYCRAKFNCDRPPNDGYKQDPIIMYGGIQCPDASFDTERELRPNGDFGKKIDNCSGNYCEAYNKEISEYWASIDRILIYSRFESDPIWTWTPASSVGTTSFKRARSIEPRNTTTSSGPGVFPRHTPSRRSMKYGEWNTKKSNPGMSNQSVTLPLPKKSIKSEVILELVYANRADGVARDFMNHYLAAAGEWDDFKLPGEELRKGPLAGWSVKNGDRYLSEGRWAYNRPPLVESVHPNTSTVTVQLISLNSKAFAGPKVEIKPLKDCECPPPFTPPPVLPPPVGPPPANCKDPAGCLPDRPPGPGTPPPPTPTPEPTPFPWPYVVPEYPLEDPKYVPTTVRVTYHSWRSPQYNCQTNETVSDSVGSTITRETSGNIAGIRIAIWDKAQRTFICDFGEDTLTYKTFFVIQNYVIDYINGGWKWQNLFDPAEGYDGISYTRDPIKWTLAKRDPGDLGWVTNVEIIKEGVPIVLPPYQNPFPDQTVPEE